MRNLSKQGFLIAAGKLTKNGVRSGHSLFTQGKSNSRGFGPSLISQATLPFPSNSPPPPPPPSLCPDPPAKKVRVIGGRLNAHSGREFTRRRSGLRTSAQLGNKIAPRHWLRPLTWGWGSGWAAGSSGAAKTWRRKQGVGCYPVPTYGTLMRPLIFRPVFGKRGRCFTQTGFCVLPEGPGVGKNGDGVRPVKKWNTYSDFVGATR